MTRNESCVKRNRNEMSCDNVVVSNTIGNICQAPASGKVDHQPDRNDLLHIFASV